MSTLKLVGACLLAVAGWYAGASVCARVTVHRIALEETTALLKQIEEEISYNRTNLNSLYHRIAQEKLFSQLQMIPTERFQTLATPRCFTPEEAKVFRDCFSRIGYSCAAQECERLTRYRMQFEDFRNRIATREQQSLAIDRKIGLAIGSMLALVLL